MGWALRSQARDEIGNHCSGAASQSKEIQAGASAQQGWAGMLLAFSAAGPWGGMSSVQQRVQVRSRVVFQSQ